MTTPARAWHFKTVRDDNGKVRITVNIPFSRQVARWEAPEKMPTKDAPKAMTLELISPVRSIPGTRSAMVSMRTTSRTEGKMKVNISVDQSRRSSRRRTRVRARVLVDMILACELEVNVFEATFVDLGAACVDVVV